MEKLELLQTVMKTPPERRAHFMSCGGSILHEDFRPPDRQRDEARFRFVWHLGFQKTGTSSFQALCRINHPQLSDHVARFQRPERTKPLGRAARRFLFRESEETRRTLVNKVGHIREKSLKWDLCTALVSDEILSGWTIYDDQGSVMTRLKRLMPVLEQSTPDCDHVFVFYTREFNSWLVSSFWEKVRHTRQSEELASWLDAVPFEKCWQAIHKDLSSVVKSPVIFRDMYEDSQIGDPLGGYLLRTAGVSNEVIESLVLPKPKNRGLPIGAKHFLLVLNQSDVSNRALRTVRNLVVANQRYFATTAPVDGPADTPDTTGDRQERKKRGPLGRKRFLVKLNQQDLRDTALSTVQQMIASNPQWFSDSAKAKRPSPPA